jgi:PEP-CTERM motif
MAYSLAAGAAATTLGGFNAHAEVQYSGIQDISIAQHYSQPLDLDPYDFDAPYDTDIYLENYVFAGGNYQGAFIFNGPGAMIGFSANGLNYASALGAGVLVDESAIGPFVTSLAYGSHNPNAQFNDVTDAYIGLGFPIGGYNHYGWIRVSINNAAGTFIIHDWAYESEVGVGILTGDTGPVGLLGDYNEDGLVDASDYTKWRDTFTAGGTDLPNDATPGSVNEDDFLYWRDHYGESSGGAGSGAAAAALVPEPGTLGLLAAGSLGLVVMRCLRKQKP